MGKILNVLEPTQLYLLITCIAGIAFLNKSKPYNKVLLSILGIMTMTEVLSSVLLYFYFSIDILYTISIVLHNGLWLYLLYNVAGKPRWIAYVTILFLLFALCNILFIEGYRSFNGYTFIIGAFMYIISFIFLSFRQLRAENFSFFMKNRFLLLSAPILFFFGLSFVFGFKSEELATTQIIGSLNLYQVIGYFVNIIYYTFLNLYIYKDREAVWKKGM